MRSPYGHGDVVADGGVDVGVVWGVEAHGATGYEEDFVVHFVPVGRGTGGVWWNGDFDGADAVVWSP